MASFPRNRGHLEIVMEMSTLYVEKGSFPENSGKSTGQRGETFHELTRGPQETKTDYGPSMF